MCRGLDAEEGWLGEDGDWIYMSLLVVLSTTKSVDCSEHFRQTFVQEEVGCRRISLSLSLSLGLNVQSYLWIW